MRTLSEKFGRRTGALVALAVLVTATIVSAPASATGTGSISGTVTDAQTSAGLAGVCVTAIGNTAPYVFNATTASDGTYTLSNLANGPYEVKVDPTCSGQSVSTLDIVSIESVTVASGAATTGVNAALVPGGSASGTVSEPNADGGVADACVEFISTTNPSDQISNTVAADGSFSVSNLTPGDYTFIVEAYCPGSLPSIYAPQTWPEPVTITSAMPVTDLNVTLEVGASISGKVTSAATKSPITGAVLIAYTTTPSQYVEVNYAVTASNGTYTVTGLPSGVYDIGFGGFVNATPNGVGTVGPYPAEQLPRSLTLAAGATASNVNFVLQPKSFRVAFSSKGHTLTNAQERALLTFSKTIATRSAVIVTGYAHNNRVLARDRAQAAAAYLKTKAHITPTLKIVVNSTANQVVIVNEGSSRDFAT
jgi:hypothetical protein